LDARRRDVLDPLQTAKLNGVNPEAYLTDTLAKIAGVGRDQAAAGSPPE
jgi:hypothetical protein